MRLGVRRVLAALAAVSIALPMALAVVGPIAEAAGDEVLSWGRNQYGQLGNGSLDPAATPVPAPVSLPEGTSVTAVSGGYGFSVALTTTGEVLTWGTNEDGQLGDGSFASSTAPVNVALPAGTTITAIAAGDDHILALTSTGQVLSWGYNEWGQLGDGTTTSRGSPVEVALPPGTTVTAIAAGAGHSLALTSTGEVLAWGDNDFGQLGDGTITTPTEPVLVHLPAGTTVTTIAGGDDHSLALTSTGEVLAWGYNGAGQLGDGTTTTRTEPVLVHLPAGTTVTGIVGASGFQSFALTATGELLAWGDNTNGQLGDGTTTTRTEPVLVHLPDGTTVTAVASGDDHTVALTSTGQVLAWGYNRYGQVGDGTTDNRTEPVAVQQPDDLPVVAIGVGSYHSLAIAQTPRTTTTLTAEPEVVDAGDPVTFTATVTCSTGTPTGTVTFVANGREIGTASIEDGVATLVTDALPEGEHSVVAHYLGDASCPESDSDPVIVTVNPVGSAQLAKTLTPGSFMDYQHNSAGRLPRFHGAVTCDLPTGEVFTEKFTVRAGESFDMTGLPVDVTCIVTEEPALTDQDFDPGDFVPVDIGEWEWARPVIAVDGVVTDTFTTSSGAQPRVEITNTLLGDVRVNKHTNVGWAPTPFKIMYSARTPTGEPQDGYVLADDGTVADPAPNTWQGVIYAQSNEMDVRPIDPATGKPLLFPAGTELVFDEAFVEPPPGYVFVGMDYWPRPVVIGPDEPHAIVEMHNFFAAAPVVTHFQKRLTGDAAHLVPNDTQFVVEYAVNGDPRGQVTLTPNSDHTIFGDFLPGDRITLSEQSPPDIPGVVWMAPTFEPAADFVVEPSGDLVITVTNEARLADASFQIQKRLEGDGAQLVPGDAAFTVDYTVNGVAAGTPLTITADGAIVDGPTLKHDDVVVFTEVTPQDIPGVAWGATTIDPPSLTLDSSAEPVVVTVTNEAVARTGSFQIQKALAGNGAGLVPPDTEFTVEGTVTGLPPGYPVPPLPTTITADGAIVNGPDGLPEGAVVTYTEVTPPPGIAGLVWEGVEISPASVTIVPGETPLITVTNTFSLSPATFRIHKEVTGEATDQVPGSTEFTVDYWVNGVQADTPLTITADGAIVNGPTLAHGDVITFAEATPPDVPGVSWGAVTIEPAEVMLDATADPPLVTVTNEASRADAGFGIRKTITGESAHRVPDTTEFTVDYRVNGVAADTPLTITADGAIVNGPTLAHGDVITFAEATPPDVPGVSWGPVTIEPAEIVLDATADPPLVTVTNEANTKPATFQIRKEVTGPAAGLVPGPTEFTVAYWANGVQADTPLTITADGTIVNGPALAHGDVITFAEKAPPQIAGVTWDVPVEIDPVELTLDAEAPTPVVTVTNTADLAAATFQIRKELTGTGADLVPPDAAFTVTYTVNGTPAEDPLTILADGTVVDGPPLRHGDAVAFTEVTPPPVPGVAWGASTIDPDTLIMDAEAGPVLVTVTNEAVERTGTFQIQKNVTGSGAGLVPDDTEFTVDYTVNGTPAATPLTLLADGTVVNGPDRLNEGDVVTFAEPTPAGIPGVEWGGATISPQTITVDPDTETPLVVVTNTYTKKAASFRIHKALTGDGSDLVPPDTEFTVAYTVNGTPAGEPLTILADGTAVDGPELTHGDVLTFTEQPPPNVPGVRWGEPTIDPAELTLDAEAAAPVVTVTNEARPSTSELTVVKVDEVSEATLPGATFDLALDDGDQTYDATTDDVVGSCDTAGDDGSCTIGDLGFGTYFWVETAAPTGYTLPADPVSPAIVIDATNAGTDLPPTIFHDPRLTTTLTVRKVDADTGKPLAGGVFELRAHSSGGDVGPQPGEGDALVGECTTGADGECSVGDLDFGDYYWYETAVPPGYVTPDDRTSAVITVDAGNAGQAHSITITNQAVGPAPPGPGDEADDGAAGPDDTGGLSDTGANIAIPVAVGIALLLVGRALLLTARRRRRN